MRDECRALATMEDLSLGSFRAPVSSTVSGTDVR
jgi:hypothetical protein